MQGFWHPEIDRMLRQNDARLTELAAQNSQILERLERIMMSQASIDAATAEITSIVTDVQAQIAQLGTDFTGIQAEVTNLEAQVAAGQPVNLTALNAAVAQAQSTMSGLDPAVAQITGLVPAPAAAPAPAAPAAPAAG